MVKYHYLDKTKFHEARAGRIGASDIPAILPDPERPTQSLSGYGRTAITVYHEKRGELEREPAGLPAEMGHYLENKSSELFIRRFWGVDDALRFRARKEQFESRPDAHAINYQSPPWHHSTAYHYDGMIVHPDVVYDPATDLCFLDENSEKIKGVTKEGVKFNWYEPALIECKSARMMATKRPHDSFVRGYDFKLTGWQGIPLKHYVQIQYQLALMQVKTAYLALIYDTSGFQVWKVDANKKWQNRIIDITGRMIKHIKTGKPPRELAMNAADVKDIYPRLDHDYCTVIGENEERAKEACLSYQKAANQEKKWKAVKQDAQDAAAVLLRDSQELRAGSESLFQWQEKRGSERLIKLNADKGDKSAWLVWLKKNDPPAYRYLMRKGYISEGTNSRYVKFKWKGE